MYALYLFVVYISLITAAATETDSPTTNGNLPSLEDTTTPSSATIDQLNIYQTTEAFNTTLENGPQTFTEHVSKSENENTLTREKSSETTTTTESEISDYDDNDKALSVPSLNNNDSESISPHCLNQNNIFLTGLNYKIQENIVEVFWEDIHEESSVCKYNYTLKVPKFNIIRHGNLTKNEFTAPLCDDFEIFVEAANYFFNTSASLNVTIVPVESIKFEHSILEWTGYCSKYTIFVNNEEYESVVESKADLKKLEACKNYTFGISPNLDNSARTIYNFSTYKEPEDVTFDFDVNATNEGFHLRFLPDAPFKSCSLNYRVFITQETKNDIREILISDKERITMKTVPCATYNINASIANISSTTITKSVTVISSDPPLFEINVTYVDKRSADVSVELEFEDYFCEVFMNFTCNNGGPKYHIIDPFQESSILNYTFENLIPYTNYDCVAILYNDDFSTRKFFNITTQEDVPSSPRNLKIVDVSSTSIKVTWESPENLFGRLQYYKIMIIGESLYDLPRKHCKLHFINRTKETTNDYFTFENLQENHAYNITVQAKTVDYGPAISIGKSTLIPAPQNVDLNYTISEREVNMPIAYFNWKFPCKAYSSPKDIQFLFVTNELYNGHMEQFNETVNINSEKDNLDNLTFDLSLKPNGNYTIYMYVINKEQKSRSKPTIKNFMGTKLVFTKTQNITIKPNGQNQFRISWQPPKYFYGELRNYQLNITSEGPLHQQPNLDYCNNELPEYMETATDNAFVFRNAYAHHKYRIDITSISNKATGEVETKYYETEAQVSEPVNNLICTIVNNSEDSNYNVDIQVVINPPCQFNGDFKHYLITLNDQQGFSVETIVTDVNYSFSLMPETAYNLIVEVVNEVGNSEQKNCTFESPSGIPPHVDLHSEMVIVERDAFNVEVVLKNDYFDPQNGVIKYYAIIIGLRQYWSNESSMGFWSETNWPIDYFWNEKGDKYQATPANWQPFIDATPEVRFKLGAQNCTGTVNEFCNGYLKPMSEYVLVIRGFTRNGYRDSSPILFSTLEDVSKTENVGLIAGVVVGVLLVIIVICIGAVLWRRRIMKPLDNDDEPTCIDDESFVFPRCVNISEFPSHFNKCMENAFLLEDEYTMLAKIGENVETSIAELPENRKKNRYINILPYDCTRVPLECSNGDYINASYIKGYSGKVEYIATQGPLESTVYDFWRMIVEQDCSVIAMVAQFKEQNKVKCHRYFPENREQMDLESNDQDGITIRCSYEMDFDFYTERQIIIQTKERRHVVTHLQFLNWPDFGCPEGTTNMLQFTLILRRHMEENSGKAVIHCSAGVGRTGTLIAVDILLQTIRDGGPINIFSTVADLRRQRTRMVQAQTQYVYIFKCINDAILHPLKLAQVKVVDPIYENLENVIEMKEFKIDNNNLNTLQNTENECHQDCIIDEDHNSIINECQIENQDPIKQNQTD